MKPILPILLMFAAVSVTALDYADIDYCFDMSHDGTTVEDHFTDPQTMVRSIASGDNYFSHVTHAPVDFHIQNPGLDTVNLFLVVIRPNGGQFTHFVKVEGGQTRSVSAAVLDGCHEFYLISMQNFRLDLEIDGQTKRMTVNNPFKPKMDFIRVRTAEDVVVTLGVDVDGKVHYIAQGNVIGTLDAPANLVRLHNQTQLPLATSTF